MLAGAWNVNVVRKIPGVLVRSSVFAIAKSMVDAVLPDVTLTASQVLKSYQKLFKKAMPNMSKGERNAVLADRARRLIFNLADYNDHVIHYGCQVAGHTCAINGTASTLLPERQENAGPKGLDHHVGFVRHTTKFLFKPYVLDVDCGSGIQFSHFTRQSSSAHYAACYTDSVKFF